MGGILFHHGLTQLDFIKAIARTLAIECSDTQRLPSAQEKEQTCDAE